MKKLLVNIFFIQFLIECSTIMAATAVEESSIQDIQEPLTISQVEKKYEKSHQGHGPYIWYKSTDSKNEIWFWYLPKKNVPMEKYEVALITRVDANDTDVINIIWPEKYRNMKFQEVYKNLYKGYEN